MKGWPFEQVKPQFPLMQCCQKDMKDGAAVQKHPQGHPTQKVATTEEVSVYLVMYV